MPGYKRNWPITGSLSGAETSDEAINNADIITAVTTSKQPVFNGRLVKEGAHVNGVGSFMPDMHELDEYIVKRADKIFFDSQEAVLAEAGDFITPLKNGLLQRINLTVKSANHWRYFERTGIGSGNYLV